MDPILILLAIAIVIIAVAILLSVWIRRRPRKPVDPNDLNANPRDGDAIATWSGIDVVDND